MSGKIISLFREKAVSKPSRPRGTFWYCASCGHDEFILLEVGEVYCAKCYSRIRKLRVYKERE